MRDAEFEASFSLPREEPLKREKAKPNHSLEWQEKGVSAVWTLENEQILFSLSSLSLFFCPLLSGRKGVLGEATREGLMIGLTDEHGPWIR